MVIHPILGIITMGILNPIDGCMTIPFYEKKTCLDRGTYVCKYESQWEGWHPIYYGKKKNVPNHQPDINVDWDCHPISRLGHHQTKMKPPTRSSSIETTNQILKRRYVSTTFLAIFIIFSWDIPWNLALKNRPNIYGIGSSNKSLPVPTEHLTGISLEPGFLFEKKWVISGWFNEIFNGDLLKKYGGLLGFVVEIFHGIMVVYWDLNRSWMVIEWDFNGFYDGLPRFNQ